MMSFHLQRFLVVLLAVISLATARDRWVWSDQRNDRQLVRILSPFFPPPFLRPAFLPPRALEPSSSRQTRRPKASEIPDVADEAVAVPSRPTARGVTQEALVVQPLPLDISKLPLETSESGGFLDVFAPHPAAALRASEQDLTPALSLEDQLATFLQDTAPPSLQTKTGHVDALVATPDISQLPLQSPSSSSSFGPSSLSDVAPDHQAPSFSRDAVVFPIRILEEAATHRTVPPPSSTPVPTRITLAGFSALDDTHFLTTHRLQEKRILKTLRALQKEYLAQNSGNIKLAFQNLQRIAENPNTVNDDDRVVFPRLLDSVGSESRHEALHLIEPPRFSIKKDSNPSTVFTLPILHPQTSSSFSTHDTQRPQGLLTERLDAEAGRPVTIVFKESKPIREGRKVPPYAWLWPRETAALGVPASHAL